jgi:hypothetical protein
MSENTPGFANAYPKVGPIVINEIMYNPSWPEGGSYTNDQYEYVELHNISASPVTLYRDDKALPWKFTDGIDFTFPADVPVTIPAGGYLLVVKDPEAFSWRYPARGWSFRCRVILMSLEHVIIFALIESLTAMVLILRIPPTELTTGRLHQMVTVNHLRERSHPITATTLTTGLPLHHRQESKFQVPVNPRIT